MAHRFTKLAQRVICVLGTLFPSPPSLCSLTLSHIRFITARSLSLTLLSSSRSQSSQTTNTPSSPSSCAHCASPHSNSAATKLESFCDSVTAPPPHPRPPAPSAQPFPALAVRQEPAPLVLLAPALLVAHAQELHLDEHVIAQEERWGESAVERTR